LASQQARTTRDGGALIATAPLPCPTATSDPGMPDPVWTIGANT
jgi:hypothetical protein